MAFRWRLWAVFASCAVLGCHRDPSPPSTSTPTFPGVTIRVGVVGDPALAGTVSTTLIGEWSATRRGEVKVLPGALDPQALGDCDVILFPGDRMGDLVDARALAVLPEKLVLPPPPLAEDDREGPAQPVPDPLQFSDVLPVFREQVSKYGKDRMAFPYGGSALVLVYHREAFERPENRAAAEKEKLTLEPPKTWKQLDALARFFQNRDWDGDGATDYGIAFAEGNDAERLGAAIFCARAASVGMHRDQYAFLFDSDTMAPRIDSPPFVEARNGESALSADGPLGMNSADLRKRKEEAGPGVPHVWPGSLDPQKARYQFCHGVTERKPALLIDRAECASRWGRGQPIGVAPLPGSERVYDPARKVWEPASPPNQATYLPFGGGWLVGVARVSEGRRREAAIDFAKYLISPEAAGQIRADPNFPMLPVRASVLGQGPPDPRGVDSRQWSEAVSRTLAAPRVIPGLRIPQANEYLEDLAQSGLPTLDADTAMQSAAERWNKRTQALGVARQLWHYRRSLNALSTTAEPPNR